MKNRYKRKLILVAIATSLATSLPPLSLGADNGIRIGGGPSSGEYISIATSICSSLGSLFKCTPVETKGTSDNRLLLERGALEVALAKSPIVDLWIKQSPSFSSSFSVIKTLGDESLFIFAKKEFLKAVGSWTGVRDNAYLLSIGLPGELSGDAVIFKLLSSVPGSPLANLEVKIFNGRTELVEAVKAGIVNMGFITQVANPDNDLFKQINGANLEIMGVVDPDMLLFGDSFHIKKVVVRNTKWLGISGAREIETANVSISIIASNPSSLQGRSSLVQEAAIQKIKATPSSDLLPKVGWMRSLLNSTSLSLSSRSKALFSSMQELAKGAKDRIMSLR